MRALVRKQWRLSDEARNHTVLCGFVKVYLQREARHIASKIASQLGVPLRTFIRGHMAAARPSIQVDVTSDTVCPWCYVGKKNIERAIEEVKDEFDVQVRWHPFFLNPEAPKEGHNKVEYYKSKFGEERVASMMEHMRGLFAGHGQEYKMGGDTGSSVDSHRLLELAGRQGVLKQNALAEELFLNYFTQEKYIGDREVLLAAAQKVGVDGAEAWLDDPNAGLPEVMEGVRKYAKGVRGVPHFRIGNVELSGAQPPEVFVKALRNAGAA